MLSTGVSKARFSLSASIKNADEVKALVIEAIRKMASELKGIFFSKSVNPTEPEASIVSELVRA